MTAQYFVIVSSRLITQFSQHAHCLLFRKGILFLCKSSVRDFSLIFVVLKMRFKLRSATTLLCFLPFFLFRPSSSVDFLTSPKKSEIQENQGTCYTECFLSFKTCVTALKTRLFSGQMRSRHLVSRRSSL